MYIANSIFVVFLAGGRGGWVGTDGVNTLTGTCKFINYTGIRITPNVESPAPPSGILFPRNRPGDGNSSRIRFFWWSPGDGNSARVRFFLNRLGEALAILREFDTSGPNLAQAFQIRVQLLRTWVALIQDLTSKKSFPDQMGGDSRTQGNLMGDQIASYSLGATQLLPAFADG